MIQCISVCPGGIANHTLMLPDLVPKLILNQPRPRPKTTETNYLWSPRVVVLCLFWNPWVTVDTMLVTFWNPGAPLGFSGRPWESSATQIAPFVSFPVPFLSARAARQGSKDTHSHQKSGGSELPKTRKNEKKQKNEI